MIETNKLIEPIDLSLVPLSWETNSIFITPQLPEYDSSSYTVDKAINDGVDILVAVLIARELNKIIEGHSDYDVRIMHEGKVVPQPLVWSPEMDMQTHNIIAWALFLMMIVIATGNAILRKIKKERLC